MKALTIVLILCVGFSVLLNFARPRNLRMEGFDQQVPHNAPLPQVNPNPINQDEFKQNDLERTIDDLKVQSHKINERLAELAGLVQNNVSNREYKMGCETDQDCNTIQWNDDRKNICRVDHTCACESGSGPFCTVPARYKDPSVMTNAERDRFKNQQDLSSFTPRDYANWLLLYKNCQEELTRDHLKNLQLLLSGASLPSEIPRKKESPPESVKQYLDLLDAGKALAIRDVNLDSGVYLPSNFTAYEDFIPPKELKNTGMANADVLKQQDLADLSSKIAPQILPKVT